MATSINASVEALRGRLSSEPASFDTDRKCGIRNLALGYRVHVGTEADDVHVRRRCSSEVRLGSSSQRANSVPFAVPVTRWKTAAPIGSSAARPWPVLSFLSKRA